MQTTSDRINQRMTELGLKQVDLVKGTDARPSTVNAWVSGTSTPTGQRLSKLAILLKTTTDWLLTGKEEASIGLGSVSTWTDGDPIPDGYLAVDYYDDVHVSAGSGYLNSEHHAPRQFLLPSDLIRDCNVNAAETNVLPVHGESMFPELKDGQLISIDTSAKKIFDGEIYAFCADGEIKIKYLFSWSDEGKGGFKAVSRNDDKTRYPDEYYSPKRIEADKVFIIGQYWWKSEARRVRR